MGNPAVFIVIVAQLFRRCPVGWIVSISKPFVWSVGECRVKIQTFIIHSRPADIPTSSTTFLHDLLLHSYHNRRITHDPCPLIGWIENLLLGFTKQEFFPFIFNRRSCSFPQHCSAVKSAFAFLLVWTNSAWDIWLLCNLKWFLYELP